MKRLLSIAILLSVGFANAIAQDATIFPRGEKAANVHHVGNVWLVELAEADSTFSYSTAQASFDAGARLDWHQHPGGQILLITDGVGYYQEKGKPKFIVRKGDVVKCPAGLPHWHGATQNSGVTYLATSPVQKGKTVWLQRVTDQEWEAPATNFNANTEKEILKLSKDKWQWMADKNVDKLAKFFHDKSEFVHMGGSWGKERELEIIKSGGIHYKKADVHEASVQIIGNTAILLNRITLLAVVGGNEVANPFMVTEVYIKENNEWKLGSLSFTKLLTPGNNN